MTKPGTGKAALLELSVMRDIGIQEFDPLRRIKGIQEKLSPIGVDAILLNYSRSVYYFSGTAQPAFLLVSPLDYQLLIGKGIEHAFRETWLPADKLSPSGLGGVVDVLNQWGLGGGVLGMELDVIPAALYFRIASMLPGFRIEDVARTVLEQRKIKDRHELDCLREAGRIVHAGHERVMEVLRDGMTEVELSAEVEDAHRRAGHEGQYFVRQWDFFMGRGVLASGENLSSIAGKVQSISGSGMSAAVPLGASEHVIRKGDMVVVDIPTLYRGYHSDQSRTYVVGKASSSCRELYQGMMEIADRAIGCLKPGVTCNDVYEMTFSVAREIGMEPFYLRLGGNPEPLFFVGHGVGLEVNELPLLSKGNNDVIRAGTVVTLEMEMWKSEKEVVKVEDTIAIHGGGAELLTISPRELHEV
ncbi:MAG: Xaa-Pro peptidase family protein [Syntrophales bacterium]|nr:Xaa-Pro peptidase family protein [Syntrophales bacterium]